jgi:hypothetical protein
MLTVSEAGSAHYALSVRVEPFALCLSVCFIRSHDAPALMYTRMPSHNHKQRLPQPYLRSALPLVLVIPILVLVI